MGLDLLTQQLYCFGGDVPPGLAVTEKSGMELTWTETGDLNTARHCLAASGSASAGALAFGGKPDGTATEEWNTSASTN